MAFNITTTNTGSPPAISGHPAGSVKFKDLGSLVYSHPTSSYDLEQDFKLHEIKASKSVQTALTNGWITATDGNGAAITTSQSITNASQTWALSGDITAAITANQNNYNPTGLSTASVLRLSSDALRTITGLSGGSDGRIITIFNTGANDIVLSSQDGASTAANQFLFSASRLLSQNKATTLIYDSTSSRWRITNSHDLTHRGYAENSTLATSTLATNTTHASLTFTVPFTANYLISWSALFNIDTAANSPILDILVNGSGLYGAQVALLEEMGENVANERVHRSGQRSVSLTAGANTIAVVFRNETAGNTISMYFSSVFAQVV